MIETSLTCGRVSLTHSESGLCRRGLRAGSCWHDRLMDIRMVPIDSATHQCELYTSLRPRLVRLSCPLRQHYDAINGLLDRPQCGGYNMHKLDQASSLPIDLSSNDVRPWPVDCYRGAPARCRHNYLLPFHSLPGKQIDSLTSLHPVSLFGQDTLWFFLGALKLNIKQYRHIQWSSLFIMRIYRVTRS